MKLTYSSYLKIPELLDLQKHVSPGPEHDETLFIIIHQVYELWFKQQIHELRLAARCLEDGNDPLAVATLRRMLTILKVMVSQLDVLETMTPLGFLSFRERLESSSGFQSAQFRVFESLVGNRRASSAQQFPEGSLERTAVEAAMQCPTIWQCFLKRMSRSGRPMPTEVMDGHLTAIPEPNIAVQDQLLEIYRHQPAERAICELLVDLDEGLQEWRYRHVKMVERTIGFKQGTGGSPGVSYLRETLFRPLFADLWAIRTRL
ncbi:MAG: tryptophan 2,3-dioxygenase family protein [Planctomycetota bacterium]|nr:tryptophan 2,3-dioxygenase family protein [Planctomycetota bacterium]